MSTVRRWPATRKEGNRTRQKRHRHLRNSHERISVMIIVLYYFLFIYFYFILFIYIIIVLYYCIIGATHTHTHCESTHQLFANPCASYEKESGKKSLALQAFRWTKNEKTWEDRNDPKRNTICEVKHIIVGMSPWRGNERNADDLMIHLFSHSLHEHFGNTGSVPSM